MSESESIEYYVEHRNKIQECIQKLSQTQLVQLFQIIIDDNPNISFSKNKNGYFIDIKVIPNHIIEQLSKTANEMIQNISSSENYKVKTIDSINSSIDNEI